MLLHPLFPNTLPWVVWPIRSHYSKNSKDCEQQVASQKTRELSPCKTFQPFPLSRRYSASPPGSPQRDSPYLLQPGSPMGVSLKSKPPMFGTFRHSHSCRNKMINIRKRIIHPDTNYPQAREALECTNICHIQLGNTSGPSHAIATSTPGFETALCKIFGDNNIADIDLQALV